MPCPTFPTFDTPNEVKLGRFNVRMTQTEIFVVIGGGFFTGITVGVLLDTFTLGLVTVFGTGIVLLLVVSGLKIAYGRHYIFELLVRMGIQRDAVGILSPVREMRVLTPEPHPARTPIRGAMRDLGMIDPADRFFPPGGFIPAVPTKRLRQRDLGGASIGKRLGGDAMVKFLAHRKQG